MIAGVLLAAGLATRFGADKRMHEIGGRPLIDYALEACTASRLDSIFVVIGSRDEHMRSRIGRTSRVRTVENTGPKRGMMSSVKVALAALPEACEAAMIVHGDMPLVTAALIDRLIDAFESGRIVVPQCDGEWQHPRIIPRLLFKEFLALGNGERGTTVIRRHLQQILLVEEPDYRLFLDVDVIEDAGLAETFLAGAKPTERSK